ncbi:MAG TPA: hypothetical protein DCR14_07625 [Acidimicrobiaceae bacterium]|nr:hypothetical protein [Acidimicrobiaceae bacterium]
MVALAAVMPFVGRGVGSSAGSTFHFALIGDLPYTSADSANMPAFVADINNDAQVTFVAHAGDIKNGSTTCATTELQTRFDQFQAFDDAFWYTPGDNEWTDCHRATPASNPLERLAALRGIFYPNPAETTGGTPRPVESQASDPTHSAFVENTMFHEQCVTFGAIHVVGSGNGTEAWVGETASQTQEREAAVTARSAANVAWIDEVFDTAIARGSEGVFLLMQAAPSSSAPFSAVRTKIVARAQAFGGPVIVAHGDGHVYTVTPNYLGLTNVTRWETYGATGATNQWIKVEADCDSPSIFSHTVVTTGSTPTTTSTSSSTSTSSTTSTTVPAPLPIGVATAIEPAVRVDLTTTTEG